MAPAGAAARTGESRRIRRCPRSSNFACEESNHQKKRHLLGASNGCWRKKPSHRPSLYFSLGTFSTNFHDTGHTGGVDSLTTRWKLLYAATDTKEINMRAIAISLDRMRPEGKKITRAYEWTPKLTQTSWIMLKRFSYLDWQKKEVERRAKVFDNEVNRSLKLNSCFEMGETLREGRKFFHRGETLFITSCCEATTRELLVQMRRFLPKKKRRDAKDI